MARRRAFTITTSMQRSAIANGSRLLDGLDQRSAPARRFRDLQFAMCRDVTNGVDPSEAQLQLIRTAAGLVVMREALDSKVLNGEKVDASEYTRIANTLRRVLVSLGLERRAKDITPDLQSYLRQKARHAEVIDSEAAE